MITSGKRSQNGFKLFSLPSHFIKLVSLSLSLSLSLVVIGGAVARSGCLIGGDGGWIFLCLDRKKIFGFGFGWKENFWVCV